MRFLARIWPDCQPCDSSGDRAEFWLNRASRTVQCKWGNDERSSPPEHLPATSRSIGWKWNSFEILIARRDTPAHYACANINTCGRRRWRVGFWNFGSHPMTVIRGTKVGWRLPRNCSCLIRLEININNCCWFCVRVCMCVCLSRARVSARVCIV